MQAIGFLLMGLSGLGLVAGGGLVLYALRTERPALITHLGVFALGWAALYLVVLVATSLTSQETVLSLNERKAFCGFYFDCHLGVSVESIQQATHVGEGPSHLQAEGVFYLITVRVSSDARRAKMALQNPKAVLIDARGVAYSPSLHAGQTLAASEDTPRTLARSVTAGDAYTTTLVFDVPSDVTAPKLHITQGAALDRFIELFLIGDEDSLFHRKTMFAV